MFRKYNSIENSYQAEFIERIIGHGYGDEEFVVQEKAHGANMSFWTTDGENSTAAKRTGILEPDEKFYNHLAVTEKTLPKLKSLWNELNQAGNELQQLTVFGELIGGDYAHPDVPKDKTSIKVQKGIYYSPSNEFYAFDILINNDYFLDVDKAEKLFVRHNFTYAKTLFRGTLEECLNYPNDFESMIHEQFSLPKIEPNIIEGVVIKTTIPRFLNNGSRIMLKNKNQKWAEKAKVRKREIVVAEISVEVKQLQENILAYVTENRMNNVASKIGEITAKNMGKVLGMFAADVLEDFLKDHKQEFNQLDKKDQKLVTKFINKPAVELVKKRLI